MSDVTSSPDTTARPDPAAGAGIPAQPAAAAAATRWVRRAASQRAGTGMRDCWDAVLVATARETETLAGVPATLFPHYTVDGRWRLLDIGTVSGMTDGRYEHGNWTAGFSLGVLWLDALGRGATPGGTAPPAVREARRRLGALLPRATDHTTHDLGFLFYPGVALGHDLGWVDQAGAQSALQAARQLYLRYNPRTQLIQAFGPARQPGLAGTSTIDTMMNLPLLFWAARHGADPVLADAALRHARTSARLYFRPDGSTYHLLTLDPVSGALLGRGTFQGAADGSCWSRGQAWAVAGFAWAYGVSRERELLEAADRAAAYFFGRLPADAVAPWDFSAASDGIRDASASAAVALGCLLLAQAHAEPAAAAAYRAAGTAMLSILARDCLNTGPAADGLLLHSCYSKPHNLGTDSATAWGDFYFTLAMALAAGKVPVSTLWPLSAGGRGLAPERGERPGVDRAAAAVQRARQALRPPEGRPGPQPQGPRGGAVLHRPGERHGHRQLVGRAGRAVRVARLDGLGPGADRLRPAPGRPGHAVQHDGAVARQRAAVLARRLAHDRAVQVLALGEIGVAPGRAARPPRGGGPPRRRGRGARRGDGRGHRRGAGASGEDP